MITGSSILAGAELILHFAIDYAKGKGEITQNVDQALHFLCKLWYVAILMVGRF